ncbi:MAG TPA: hypothetical protein VF160_01370, partial [Candidatus Dormibacteraeota bacterium]
MTGTVTYSGNSYGIDLMVDSRRRASGSITTSNGTVQIQDDGDVVYMQGRDYFGKLLKFPVFDRWVKYPAAPVANLALQVTDRAAMAKSLEAAAGKSVKSKAATASGVRTTALSSPSVTVQVAGSRPVQIDTLPGIQAGPDISQVSLWLSAYGSPVQVTVPTKFVDSADSGTWPPYFVYLQGFGYDGCDSNGCTMKGTFENYGGKGEGAATVHFLVKDRADGHEVAGCDAPFPATDSNASTTVSCRVS